MTPLTETPDEIRIIRDDVDAKALLIQLGIIEKLPKRPALATKWAATLNHSDHPTHWIIATRFSGYPDAIDNGFDILCYPKSRFSTIDMERVLADRASQLSHGEIEGKFVSVEPTQN